MLHAKMIDCIGWIIICLIKWSIFSEFGNIKIFCGFDPEMKEWAKNSRQTKQVDSYIKNGRRKKKRKRPLGFYCTFPLLPSKLVDRWVMLGLSHLHSSILQHLSAPADAIASVRMDNFDFFIIRFEFSTSSTTMALLTVLGCWCARQLRIPCRVGQ